MGVLQGWLLGWGCTDDLGRKGGMDGPRMH